MASAAPENVGPDGGQEALTVIIEDTTDEVFEVAGGFAFTDEIALGLNKRWRTKAMAGAVPVDMLDLAWLLDGYARARLSMPRGES